MEFVLHLEILGQQCTIVLHIGKEMLRMVILY